MTDHDDYHAEVQRLRAELDEARRLTVLPGGKDAPRKRISTSDVLDAFLDRMRNDGGTGATVKLTRNAKGDVQIEVSVRTGDTPEITSAEDAAAKARSLYDGLAAIYPMLESPAPAPSKGGAK